MSFLAHGVALGALVAAAGPTELVPRVQPIRVTLLADGEKAPAVLAAVVASAAVEPAPASARPEPAAPAEPRAPALEERTAPPPKPRAERPHARSAQRPTARVAAAAASAPAASREESAGPANDGAGAPPAAGPVVAALVPAGDVARVYGEGEVDRAAAPVGGIRRPEYPPRERMLGRQGRVSLVVEVDEAGAVREVTVARSAGEAFDAAARRAVERTPFRAARLADRPVASRVTVNVSFELD